MHFRSHLGAVACVVACATAGCTIQEDGTPPPAYATTTADENVVYAEAPPAVETYPRVWYQGQWTYYVGDRWYRSTPRGWAYYASEPPELHHQRDVYGAHPPNGEYPPPPNSNNGYQPKPGAPVVGGPGPGPGPGPKPFKPEAGGPMPPPKSEKEVGPMSPKPMGMPQKSEVGPLPPKPVETPQKTEVGPQPPKPMGTPQKTEIGPLPPKPVEKPVTPSPAKPTGQKSKPEPPPFEPKK